MPPTSEELRRQAEAQRQANEELEEFMALKRQARGLLLRLLSNPKLLEAAESLALSAAVAAINKNLK